jgi:hypothetical protein
LQDNPLITGIFMLDLILLATGLGVFAVLGLYISACGKV